MDYNGWAPISELGRGGQGTVYKARRPERVRELNTSLGRIAHHIRQISGIGPKKPSDVEDLAKRLADISGPDPLDQLGALKVFKIPENDPTERGKVVGRLQAEMKALQDLKHPAVLRLLDGSHLSANELFMVTEYHPKGTLHENLHKGPGKAPAALTAFRPLVEAVAQIHQLGAIHRDIKPKNIFVNRDGHLVLGDFGIVFFGDAGHTRLTDTYERVGSRDWMAPWANLEQRLEEVNPTLDIYPLGKILWCMVSGRSSLPFWYFNRSANDVCLMFPDDPAMRIINEILGKCVVEDQEKCIGSATLLLELVDEALASLRQLGKPPRGINRPWYCLVCGQGQYARKARYLEVDEPGYQRLGLAVLLCDHCGHAQFFKVKENE